MIQYVRMPKLGQTMEEATIERWVKAEGDAVKRGDVLLEITTDKATLEVESFVNGTLRKILGVEGETLPVNTVIALVGEPGDALPDNIDKLKGAAPAKPKAGAAEASAKEGSTPAAAPSAGAAVAPAPAGRIVASPRARRRAKEEKVNLRLLRGSGPNGRIVEADVEAYAEKLRGVKATPMARQLAFERGVDLTTMTAGGRIRKEDVLAAAPAATGRAARRVPLSAMRRVIAQRMTESKQQIPHFYLTMDVAMAAAIALRKQRNEAGGVRIAFHDLMIRAAAIAFTNHPLMNAAWEGDAVLMRDEVNIGLAVALDEGLIVPVVRGADKLSLEATAKESQRLIERARSKRLTPDEFEGGVFTISNLGMYGVDNFIPVINPGESAILGMARIAERVIARDGMITVRPMMTLTLSGDHRVIDGAIAAAFLARLKELLETPDQLAK